MDRETCISLCMNLAKAYSTGVRLYDGEVPIYYYCISHMKPDPATPYIRDILDAKEEAGIITTPLYQLYGFFALQPGIRAIIGPTRILQDDKRTMELLLATLGIRQQDRENYIRLLRSAPNISADRLAWLIASLLTAIQGKTFPVENVWLQIRPNSVQEAVQTQYVNRKLDIADDVDLLQTLDQSYAWEQLVLSYVANGQPEMLRELFNAPPNIKAGRIAHDGLRQMKNMGICTATGVSRAAIQGGMEPQQAFCMSDLYIQKLELMKDVLTVERLIQEMMLDFAEQVEKLHLPTGRESRFYRMCARYVSENLFTTIRAEEMAQAMGYTRAYLCTRFKQEAGMSLTQYIHKEKTAEAKRLLQFTDQDLGQIAALLDFSSQSHFQTVFRKVTGETPMAYRMRTKVIV